MSSDFCCQESENILDDIDIMLRHGLSDESVSMLKNVKKHIYFLESEIAQLKKACAEWSEVSQHNYQKAKSMALALDAIKAVVKATSTTGETE